MHKLRSLTLSLIFLCVALSTLPAFAQNFSAKVNKNKIQQDENITLTLTYTGDQAGDPSLSDIETQFDIIQTRQNNVRRLSNGRIESSRQWVLILQPKRDGTLLIPSIKIGNDITDAIVITVDKPIYNKTDTNSDTFFKTIVSHDSVYVQQQLLLKYKLYYRQTINSVDHSLHKLNMDNIVLQDIEGEAYSETVNGRQYKVQEVIFAIFPQQSGTLEIPAIEWKLNMKLPGYGRYKTNRLITDKKTIEVKPIPSSFPAGATWLPSENISLESRLSTNPGTIKTGDPLTRTLTLQAQGLMEAQLPSISTQKISDIYNLYPETPTTKQTLSASGVQSVKTQKEAIVINQSGNITLPEVSIAWWNTTTDSLEYASSVNKTINVTASNELLRKQAAEAAQEPTASPTASKKGHNFNTAGSSAVIWQIISAILFILLLIFIYLWYRASYIIGQPTRKINKTHSTKATTTNRKILAQLKNACETNDAMRIKEYVISWGQSYFKNQSIQSLNTIIRITNNDELKRHLNELDAILYATVPPNNWQPIDIYRCIKQYKQTVNNNELDAVNSLPPLYPL